MKNKTNSTKALWSCGVAAFSAFLPWVTLTTILGTINVTGLAGDDGKVTLAIAVMAAGLILGDKPRAARVLAWVGVVYSVAEFASVQSKLHQVNGDVVHASIGIGIYLTAIGFVGAVVFLTKAVRARKAATAMMFMPPSVSA